MTRIIVIVLAAIIAVAAADRAEAAYRVLGYYGPYDVVVPCEYVVRRRGYPSATEYYFVERCLVPVELRDRWRGKTLRSRG